MVKKFIKKNDKIYEVQENEVKIADLEYDIEIAWEHLTKLQAELASMNAVKS